MRRTSISGFLAFFLLLGCSEKWQSRTDVKNAGRTLGKKTSQNADVAANTTSSQSAEGVVEPSPTAIDLAGKIIPLEAKLVSITSNTDGRQPDDPRKASNIYSLAADIDPYFDQLPVGTKHLLENFAYLRDDPERSIVLSVPLIAVQRSYEGTPRDMWWVVDGVVKVKSYKGSWDIGDKFSKHAKDGYGEQWSFNYVISRVKTNP